MVYPILRTFFFPLLRFFIKKTVGLENLPSKGPFIMACKHIGALDGFFLASVVVPRLNQKVHFIASIMKWGWLWEKVIAEQWAGCIPFDKNNRQLCLEMALRYLKKGEIVVIFPEGYLHEYKRTRKTKTGVARLALWAKVPVIPVGLVYNITVRSDLPVLYQTRKAIINTILNPHSLEIHIGQPFELKQYYNKEITKELLREATNTIMDKIKGLTKIDNINQ